ncbi:MAG: hypothetical protein AAF399_03130 [Bacteroidota bacterium]
MHANAAPPFPTVDWSTFEPLMNLPVAHTFLPWNEPTFVLVRYQGPEQSFPLSLTDLKSLVKELPGEVWVERWQPELEEAFPTITFQSEGIGTGHCYFPWKSWQHRYRESMILAAIHHAVLFHGLVQDLPLPEMYADRLKGMICLLPFDPNAGYHWLHSDGQEVSFHQSWQLNDLADHLLEMMPPDRILEIMTLLTARKSPQQPQGYLLHAEGLASWEALPTTFPHTPPLPIKESLYWWAPVAGQVIYQSADGYGPVFQCHDGVGEFPRTQLRDLLQISPYSPYSGSIALLPFELLRMKRSVCRYFPDTPILRPKK